MRRKLWQQLDPIWSRASRLAWIILGADVVLLLVLRQIAPFGFVGPHETPFLLALLALIVTTAGFAIEKGCPREAAFLETQAILVIVAVVMTPLSFIFAATALPYQDKALLAIDRTLGIDWTALAIWFRDHPAVSDALNRMYASIGWQPALFVPALAILDPERLRRWATAFALAATVTVLIFLLLPASGGYAYLHFHPADFPNVTVRSAWNFPKILEGARQGSHALEYEGIVAFPSFHAASAFLFAYAWRAVPIIGIPLCLWNVGMLVSCVPIGSHYVIDVIAGVAVAYASVRAADRYYRATDTLAPLPHLVETERWKWLVALIGRTVAAARQWARGALGGLLGRSIKLETPVS